jgi:hypothetical protein
MKSTQDEPSLAPPAPAAPEHTGVAGASPSPAERPKQPALPREIGGRDGPEPTRFGDWEKGGRCIDF